MMRISTLVLTVLLLLTVGRVFYIHFAFFVPADRAVTEAKRSGTMEQFIRALDAEAAATDCSNDLLCFSPAVVRWDG